MWPFFERHGVDGKDYFSLFPLKDYHFPLHFHRAYEIIYVNGGQLTLTVDDREYTLQKQDSAFIFPNQLHQFASRGHSEITIILFSPEWIGDFHMNYKGCIPTDNVLTMAREPDFSELDSIYAQKSFLYGVCADIVRRTSFTRVKQSPETKVLYKILLYVEENYASDCTLKAIAKHLQYDYPYLSKQFIRLMKMPFTDYLNRYRISQACYILKNSNQSIGEVASQCGFNNLRSFHRNFRIITRQSPKEYRDSKNNA